MINFYLIAAPPLQSSPPYSLILQLPVKPSIISSIPTTNSRYSYTNCISIRHQDSELRKRLIFRSNLVRIPLKDLKESNPIYVAEYAIANKIEHEPAFAWWVPKFIKRRDRNVFKLKTRKFIQRSHKFGIEVPRTIKRALEIGKETGTTFWFDAINKEMKNNKSAFDILESSEIGGKVPPGYTKITCHMIFDIKMDFTRKA